MRNALKVLLFLAASVAFAQPATTTVADTFYAAIGGPTYCYGTFTLSWQTFYSQDGFLIQAGTSAPVTVSAMGTFSVPVVPTNVNTTPASGVYTVNYRLQPAGCAPATESWNVPVGGGPVTLNQVRTVPTPPPSLIPVTSLYPGPGSGTYTLCSIAFIVQWGSCGGGGGGGTVTSLSIGSLAPLFTANVSNPTTTPAISFSLTAAAGFSWFGNSGSSSGAPAYHTSALPISLIPALTSGSSILYGNGSGFFSNVTIGSGLTFSGGTLSATGGGSGTVTSVALTMPGIFGVTGSPVTVAGTLGVTLNTESANLIWAGPTTGSAATPSFRALVSADLPSITCGQMPALTGDTTSTAGSCSVTVTGTHGQPLPASANLLSSNSSAQILQAEFENIAIPRQCIDSGSSGTAYTCSTSPGEIASSGDELLFSPHTTNTGAATVNVNGAGVIAIKKQQGSTALAAGDLIGGRWTIIQYDGTQWEMTGQVANAASGATNPFIQPLTAPIAGNFTQYNYNVGTSVVTAQTNNSSPVTSITLSQQDPGNTENIAALGKAKLAATFTVTIGFTAFSSSDQGFIGLWLADSTPANQLIWGYQTGFGYRASYFTNFTSYGGDAIANFATWPFPAGPLIWERIQETGSARIYSTSTDGINFLQIATESNTAHFTTASYGFAMEPRMGGAGNFQMMGTLYSFTETNP